MTRSNNWGMFSLASARSNSWLSLKKFRPQNPWYIILTGFKLNKMSYMCEEVYQHCNICNVLYRLCFLSNNGYFNKSNCLHFIPPDQTQSFRGYGNPRGLQWGAKRRMCQGNGVCKMIKCIDEMGHHATTETYIGVVKYKKERWRLEGGSGKGMTYVWAAKWLEKLYAYAYAVKYSNRKWSGPIKNIKSPLETGLGHSLWAKWT